MTSDSATLYQELGRLVEQMPDFSVVPVPTETHRWVGRAYALVSKILGSGDSAMFSVSANGLGTALHGGNVATIQAIVFRALAVVERDAPPGMHGAFIPAASPFDAFAAVLKVLEQAKADILIVDPYMDEAVLTEFAQALPPGVALRLMADEASVKGSLKPTVERWVQQHGGSRPVEARLSPPKTLHDRAIFIDGKIAFSLSQSLKDFAKRSPAEIVRADSTTAQMKIEAYEALWQAAKPL